MMGANECRANAKRCLAQAAETSDPVLKARLAETAQGWARLAADYANFKDRTSPLAGFREADSVAIGQGSQNPQQGSDAARVKVLRQLVSENTRRV
jgi:hypothetical protein